MLSFVLTLISILLLLSQPLSSLSFPNPKSTKSQPFTFTTSTIPRSKKQAVALPLRKHFATNPLMSKLTLHHNISLTVQISVGTPPQNLSLVLDTGSELSWLLCNPTSAPHFRPLSSTSFSPLPCSSPFCLARDLPMPPDCDPSTNHCHVSLSYADASTSEGYLSRDAFLLTPSSPPVPAAFGCMDSTYSSSPDDRSTAGILGMNRGSLSFVAQTKTRRFSYCVSDRDGVLLIGDSGFAPANLNYTPLVEISLPLPYFDRFAYSIQLEGIKLGDVILPIPKSVLVPDHTGAGQTMVDSGTQFTFLLGPAYAALRTEFVRWTSRTLRVLDEPSFAFQGAFDTCFLVREGTALPAGLLPDVSLVFRGAEVRVRGERLLYRVGGERRGLDEVWCLTFGNSDLVPMEAYVIGHHHQQNLWVDYDLENARVGFAPVQCDRVSRELL